MPQECEKLYYADSLLTRFEAVVTGCEEHDGSYLITLDRTAFYPEGGGQPADRGRLGGADVLDVHEREGRILHTAGCALPPGQAVSGEIDFSRRLDHMQQHTGEHIVSGIVYRRLGLRNVGFHLGQREVTLDFDGEIGEKLLGEIELEANEAVWRDLPVTASWPKPDELQDLDYRSKKELCGPVRIVTIPGIDVCACCGTHLPRTGMVGAIRLAGGQRYKGGTRVTLYAGGRALRDYGEKDRTVASLCALLSQKSDALEPAVQRLLSQQQEEKARCALWQERCFKDEADALPAGVGTVVAFWEGLSPDEVRRCALSLMQRAETVLALSRDGDAWRYAACSAKEDMRPLAKSLGEAFGGRGGGKPELVQGSLQGECEALRDFALRRLPGAYLLSHI
ncbi:alanyl-tRNA editing protein [Harryflintia acetispora]|uniref:Alanyl-tRNA synthetase n=1 Tax=Harryflintia acetispora TaxID=1849041 RepID=A0A9X8UHV3_9FIRM|nr:alanyl-tRNA editing protein [Harryflintia acetispora]TCL42431.1 alanyl-tRNA synthetase [Harryflintia acetispora]